MTERIKTEAKQYNHLISEIDNTYHEAAVSFGMSDSEMMIVYTAAEQDGSCMIGDITKSGISKQTVNSALRKMEKEDKIRLENARGKEKRIILTPHGEELAERTARRIINAENRIFSSWEREEWELYLKLTERFLASLKEEIKEL